MTTDDNPINVDAEEVSIPKRHPTFVVVRFADRKEAMDFYNRVVIVSKPK